ncbi:hypothetical protein Taro_018314 [Colocasia esculenta]|uniref:Uncharacterized protein n=1 Tax=Colocasia esculenta TaxID=4460 RepID=A0A843UR31_COLES|nr:hypothetical protein [Colocasia esculenta]
MVKTRNLGSKIPNRDPIDVSFSPTRPGGLKIQLQTMTRQGQQTIQQIYLDFFIHYSIRFYREDGDIICYQKSPPLENEELCRYPDVSSFLEYVHNRLLHFSLINLVISQEEPKVEADSDLVTGACMSDSNRSIFRR